MSDSKTLYKLFKETDQLNMIAKLKNINAELLYNKVGACGPNVDYPLPWRVFPFHGTSICSIISQPAGGIDNTVISMITIEDAEKVMKEIK